jgi:hypothetical protein
MKAKGNKPKIKLTILKEDEGFTAVGQWKDRSLATCGDTWEGLQSMIVEMLDLVFQGLGYTYAIDEVQFEYDLQTFFAHYKVINAKALSERIGMNQSLQAQYVKGIKKPSPSQAQAQRILTGVQKVGKELASMRFVFKLNEA